MAKFDVIEYQIIGEFLPSLFNGDDDGLEEDDKAALASFLEREKLPKGHWVMEPEAESYFARCDICDLYGNVYDVQYVVME